MLKRNAFVAIRVFFGLLALVAIGTQLTIHISNGFNLLNFFSYFTNLSNLFAAVVLLISAARLASGRKPTVADDVIRGTSVTCMALVGIVFSVLLQDVELGHLLPWVNVVLHYVMPVVVVLDWLYQPARAKLAVKHISYWMIFPAAYLAYSIIRGATTGWYAYPFFNPDLSGGYGGVALYCIGILITFLVTSWLLMKLGNKLKRNA